MKKLEAGMEIMIISVDGYGFMSNRTAHVNGMNEQGNAAKITLSGDLANYWVEIARMKYDVIKDGRVPSTPTWDEIDRNNLPNGVVVCKRLGNDEVCAGVLEIMEDKVVCIQVAGGRFFVSGITHYIRIQDLKDLPIK